MRSNKKTFVNTRRSSLNTWPKVGITQSNDVANLILWFTEVSWAVSITLLIMTRKIVSLFVRRIYDWLQLRLFSQHINFWLWVNFCYPLVRHRMRNSLFDKTVHFVLQNRNLLSLTTAVYLTLLQPPVLSLTTAVYLTPAAARSSASRIVN